MLSPSLLIVDDSFLIRRMIREAAEACGWHIAAEAENGRDAVEAYRVHQPDVVTMDLVMPSADGMSGLRGIRGIDPAAQVLVVSALDQKPVLREALAAGASDFVCKPFAPDALSSALAAAQQRRLSLVGRVVQEACHAS